MVGVHMFARQVIAPFAFLVPALKLCTLIVARFVVLSVITLTVLALELILFGLH